MIKGNEIRLGNKFKTSNKGDIVTVKWFGDYEERGTAIAFYEGEHYTTYLESNNIETIPLTPEILDKTNLVNSFAIALVYHEFTKTYALVVNGNPIENKARSLHQFQNLYFALTGKELEVKL